MTKGRVVYGADYWNKCAGYEDKEIALAINAGRIAMVDKYVGAGAPVLDMGIGCGEFIKKRPNTYGYDVNFVAIKWLKDAALWLELRDAAAFTFWDVLEHVEEPNKYFAQMQEGVHLFASLPVFENLERIRESKHYRPGEHLYYFTPQGFVDWIALYRFRLLEQDDYETRAGRESIASFAFVRDLPGYHQTVGQYREIHGAAYGTTAYLYFDDIVREVLAAKPMSVIDYGCGRSDLVAHFWRDGHRRIARYDPGIPQYEIMPDGTFDIVLCMDVMEHILMPDVERILKEIRNKSGKALFTISLRPARKKLPDGRNAHVTLLTEAEWTRWVQSVFGVANKVPLQWDHILMLKTW